MPYSRVRIINIPENIKTAQEVLNAYNILINDICNVKLYKQFSDREDHRLHYAYVIFKRQLHAEHAIKKIPEATLHRSFTDTHINEANGSELRILNIPFAKTPSEIANELCLRIGNFTVTVVDDSHRKWIKVTVPNWKPSNKELANATKDWVIDGRLLEIDWLQDELHANENNHPSETKQEPEPNKLWVCNIPAEFTLQDVQDILPLGQELVQEIKFTNRHSSKKIKFQKAIVVFPDDTDTTIITDTIEIGSDVTSGATFSRVYKR